MKRAKPLKFLERLLSILSSSGKTGILGDTEEEYLGILSKKGRFKADLWYASQIIKPLPFLIRSTLAWSLEMFKNYWISFLRILKRQRLYAFINITGLAVGLACCILIFLWIKFELSYDRFHENRDDLYQVTSKIPLPDGDLLYFTNTPGALAQALKTERPEVRNVSRLVDKVEMMLGTKDLRFLEEVRFVDPAFLEMFTLEFIEGNPKTALDQPASIILTEKIAEKYFADLDALYQDIVLGANTNLSVTGIIEEMPANSFLDSICLVPMAVLADLGWNIDRWGGGNFETYIHLKKDANLKSFNAQIKDFYKSRAPNWAPSQLSLRPITRIHLYGLSGGGPIVYVYIFSGLTVFILLLAVINFINLSTARSVQRSKEIGVRKIVGASRQQLRKQILMESLLVTLFSGGLALVISYFLLPILSQVIGAQISFSFDGNSILLLTGIIILTGILSGIYPAFILSAVQPVQVYKGGISPKQKSLLLRKVLIAFQFSLAIFMLITMIGVNKQLQYLFTKDLGYNRSNVVSLGLAQEISGKFATVQTELMQNPEILSVTRSSSTMGEVSTTTGGDAITWEGQAGGREMPRAHLMRVDPEWIETFEVDMAAGRFFSNEFPVDRTESVVINETALKTMALKAPIGKRITVWNRNFRIIGVIKDFHFYSLHEEIQPLIFINRYAGFNNIFVRINSQNLPRTITFIQDKLKEIAPGYVPDLKFLDENLQNIYTAEQRMEKLTKYFTGLAIFISCIGLLGLVSFSARQRTKEIAIRKVLGASEGNIAYQLFKEILICVAAANVVVYPLAYLVLRDWLENYAYHTSLGLGIFILSSALTLAIAALSIGWNVLKASLANPVDSLRYE